MMESPNTAVEEDLKSRSAPDLMLVLTLEALKAKHERLNALAAELLTRFGEQPVDRLVRAAVDKTNRSAHRLRALRVLEQIAAVWDTGTFSDLMSLTQDRDGDICDAAAMVILRAQTRR